MPEEMTPAAVIARVSAFVEGDWKSQAQQLVEDSKSQNKQLVVRPVFLARESPLISEQSFTL